MARQNASKSTILLTFSDAIESLPESALSPPNAAASLQELPHYPKVHHIVAHLERDGDYNFIVCILAGDGEVSFDDEDLHKRFSYHIALQQMTPEAAIHLVRNGLAPILERFVVAPQGVPRAGDWLLNAAKMLVMGTNEQIKLFYTEPAVVIKDERASALLTIDGVDPKLRGISKWSYRTMVNRFLIPSTAEVNIPNEKNIIWRDSINHSRTDLVAGRKTTDYKFGLFLTATFDGFLGSKADFGNRLRTLVTKVAMPLGTTYWLFLRPDLLSVGSIRDFIPWQVATYPHDGGLVRVTPKPSVMQHLAQAVKTIELRGVGLNGIVEVLTAMLEAIITGTQLRVVFARGTFAADLLAFDHGNGLEIPAQPVCSTPGDSSHWHICTACFDGFPRSPHHSDSQSPPMCRTCFTDGKTSGYKLEARSSISDGTPEEVFYSFVSGLPEVITQVKEPLRATAKQESDGVKSKLSDDDLRQQRGGRRLRDRSPSSQELNEREARWAERDEAWLTRREARLRRRAAEMREDVEDRDEEHSRRKEQATRRERSMEQLQYGLQQREQAIIAREETLDEIFASAGAKERELNSRATDLLNLETTIVHAMDPDQQVDYLAAKMRALDPAEQERLMNSFPPLPAPE